MKKIFLADCPVELKNSLMKNQEALTNFLNMNYFKQRSVSIYVSNAKNQEEISNRIEVVINRLLSL